MQYLKARIFAVLLILVCSFLVWNNWNQLWREGTYSTKLASFGPVVIVGGFFLLLFPSMAGRPTNAIQKVIVLAVFLVGLVAGLINWFLMDPGFFGR